MPDASKTIIALENKFWQSMVDQDPDTAISLLTDRAVMVSSHGALQFTADEYRKMADQGPSVVTGFKLDDVKVLFPNDATAVVTYKATQEVGSRDKKTASRSEVVNDTSTWVKDGSDWKCVMHTESPAAKPQARH